MSASLGLYRLQVVDSQIDDIHRRLDEIRDILEDVEELRQAKSLMGQAEEAHKLASQELKKAEEEVAGQKRKIERTESSLYGGSVKNPKELEDLQNESAALKRYLSTLEDRQLEAMLAEEEALQGLQTAQEGLEKIQDNLADQNKTLAVEQENLARELERLESERLAVEAPLEKGMLAKYDGFRKEFRGLAVVQLSEGACSACGTTLTPAQAQNARSREELYHCPTCGRIIYAQ